MKRIYTYSLLLAIAVSMTLASGCGKKADTTAATSSAASAGQIDAGKEAEIKRVQNDPKIPEKSKPGIIASIRAQGK